MISAKHINLGKGPILTLECVLTSPWCKSFSPQKIRYYILKSNIIMTSLYPKFPMLKLTDWPADGSWSNSNKNILQSLHSDIRVEEKKARKYIQNVNWAYLSLLLKRKKEKKNEKNIMLLSAKYVRFIKRYIYTYIYKTK